VNDSAFRNPPPPNKAEGLSTFASRLRWLLAIFVVCSLSVFARLIALEICDGIDYRAQASEPTVRERLMPTIRGRILARDGTILAYDQPLASLAIDYRWIEQPSQPRWLRQTARARLLSTDRRDPTRLAAAQQEVLAERKQLITRLAALCQLNDDELQSRCRRIQSRVEAISARVSARQLQQSHSLDQALDMDESASWLHLVGCSITDALFSWDELPASPTTVAEEQSDHVVFEELSLEAVTEIESHPDRYPGVRVRHQSRRIYPESDLAAHAVGYLARSASEDGHTGRAGVERQYDELLRGQPGVSAEQIDSRGNSITSAIRREPVPGNNLLLTLDPALQLTAQSLLDQAVAHRLPSGNDNLDRASGGAILALDVHTGEILAAASAPRYDPNGFTSGDRGLVEHWLNDPAGPLLDRTIQMALPPGSVFKIVSAAALSAAGVDPRAPVDCQGYLHQPDSLRCAIFRRYGIGHGPVTLADALARSCNVYFFHHAEQLGGAPLVDWARRFELGRPAGIDLPGESGGTIRFSETSKSDGRLLAIGQGPITTTPLQIVRLMAAIANGGILITPHIARLSESNALKSSYSPPKRIAGLTWDILTPIRKGLSQAVTDPQGTAHATVQSAQVSIAGKTGTAETGDNQPEHAWFAGYAPADEPWVAFVVVLEHAGNADTSAGPVARQMVERMNDLGYFKVTSHSALTFVKRALP
jgi:penicillin-binding protein 2